MLDGKQIFFIAGTHKSGTTWLQLLLNAHPDVSCSGEGHFPQLCFYLKQALDEHDRVITRINNGALKEIEGYRRLEQNDVARIYATCISIVLAKQSEHKKASAIGDKTPQNVRYLYALSALFPAAKFIHIVRDGRDCATSVWFHNQRLTKMWNGRDRGLSFEDTAKGYAHLWVADLEKAKAFNDEKPGRMMRVRYEDLVANVSALADLFRFLGVDSAEAAACKERASFSKIIGRNPGQEDRSSFFRKGIVGDWRNHFSIEGEAAFREQAGAWLKELGYQ